MAITGHFISVDVPEVPIGEDIEATIDFYAINPGAWYWKTFLVAVSYQLDLERELDAARETGQEGGRKKTYTLGKMPDKKVAISFFIFAHDDAAYDWSWGEFLAWLDGWPVEVTHLDSEYVFLEPAPPTPPAEWSIIGSDISLRIDVIPEVPAEWQIIGDDITLHVSLIPVGWQVIGADLTLAVALSEVPPPPCTPGETKCIGPDLYQCNLEEEWVLVEKDSPVCVVEVEKFPWLLVAGGLGVAAVAVAATAKKKKPAKEKRA